MMGECRYSKEWIIFRVSELAGLVGLGWGNHSTVRDRYFRNKMTPIDKLGSERVKSTL